MSRCLSAGTSDLSAMACLRSATVFSVAMVIWSLSSLGPVGRAGVISCAAAARKGDEETFDVYHDLGRRGRGGCVGRRCRGVGHRGGRREREVWRGQGERRL